MCDPGSLRNSTSSPQPTQKTWEWGRAGPGSSPSPAVYQLCANKAAGHLSAVQQQGGACVSGLRCSAEYEAKLWWLLKCRAGHTPAWSPLGTARSTPSLSWLPLCSLKAGLEKCNLGEGPMSLHILFPLLIMPLPAGFSLPSVPPRLSLILLVRQDSATGKSRGQESTDGKTEPLRGRVMQPGSQARRGRAGILNRAPWLFLTPLQAALMTFPSPSSLAKLPTRMPCPFPPQGLCPHSNPNLGDLPFSPP